ncbi:hypothetical protein MHK_003417 [Candidatus Magnetomorum sp. HK-1]|nr:hypothetical protein MHK_003417 [Candidatus Magnetomorum sp. HK-1]
MILGGDDLTVICRADLAIPFTKSFLKNFEIQTFKHIKKKITACAGISFVKVKYPFHYAIDLANQLCTYAKKISKEKYIQNKLAYVPSSIMFHKIQSSFIESFSDIKKRELKADASNVDFCFGPYFIEKINSDLPTLEHLCSVVNECKNDDFPSTSLRQWLSELHDNKNRAQRLWERIIQVNENFEKILSQYHYKENNNKTIIYDALSYLSLCSKGGIECLN